MNRPRRLRALCPVRARRALRTDAGTTLAEVLAGMAVMSIFLSLFAGTMLSIYRTTSRVEAVTITSGQTNTAFLRLDKMIRYASAISTPSASANAAGNYYVEIQTSNTGATVCNQLQLNASSQTLKIRSWTVSSLGNATGLTSFTALTGGVQANGTPFVLTANGSVEYEQLAVNLSATAGTSQQATSAISNSFTALNSNASSKSAASNPSAPDSVCQEVGRP